MSAMPEPDSALGWSTTSAVYVRGRNLSEDILGHLSFSDTIFLHLTGREPSGAESALFDPMLITLLEHGLTPSALATRLTILGAPESLQGAVAAGLLGLGDVFGGAAEKAAEMLRAGLADAGTEDDAASRADRIVTDLRERRLPIPGVGHPVHRPVDPRAERLWAIASEHGKHGPYVELMRAVGTAASQQTGKPLPVNATGAIGALCCELDLPVGSERGLAVIARAAGLVGHIVEERRHPIAGTVWRRTEDDVTARAVAQHSEPRAKPHGSSGRDDDQPSH